ncbi:hypothetical protein D4764_13G0004970 [Takifugu flavidus]|uniref:Uncharacterized protein n=1 Tax=Takifugu flavidus TaxID=433684 RepID=A0A5C6P8V3_9TELE|nr:hypothetical protein D4764_13G0004970 [Takifugu flavidus]
MRQDRMRSGMLSAEVFTLLPIGINPLTFHQNNKPTAAKGEPILNRPNHLLPGCLRRASTRRYLIHPHTFFSPCPDSFELSHMRQSQQKLRPKPDVRNRNRVSRKTKWIKRELCEEVRRRRSAETFCSVSKSEDSF